MRNIQTSVRNVVELHWKDVENCTTIIPMTSWQIYAEVVGSFVDKAWGFDFTHKHVAKILSDLAWKDQLHEKRFGVGKQAVTLYWKGQHRAYRWGRTVF